MRSKRFIKFKSKNQAYMIVLKMGLVWYLIIFSASYLTSNTTAYFNNYKTADGMVTFGTWKVPDESSLTFIKKGNQNIKTCEPAEIKVKLKNKGGEMKADSTYEIYYIENGNPEKHGKKVELPTGEGIIKTLKSEETIELTYKTSKSGTYVFSAVQSNDNPKEKDKWSNWIKIHCSETMKKEKDKKKGKVETKQEKQEESSESKKAKENSKEGTDKPESKTEPEPESKEEVTEPEKEQKEETPVKEPEDNDPKEEASKNAEENDTTDQEVADTDTTSKEGEGN